MDYDFDFIKATVQKFQNEKRYLHTLGVAKEAYELGKLFLPKKAQKLYLCGLLHDITKDFKTDKQLLLCKEYGIFIDENNVIPKLLHSKTGCEYAKRIFGEEIVDNEVYNAIFYHTTARSNMTLFEAIIYLADYIEEGRTFEDCVKLRNYFYENIKNSNNYEEKLGVFRKTMVLSFDYTIKNLIEEEKQIDYDTVCARNYFLTCKTIKLYQEV